MLIEESTKITKSKRLKYDGLEIRYSNIPGSFQLSTVEITRDKYSLEIDNLKVVPGMSVEKLRNHLPQDKIPLNSENSVRLAVAVVNDQEQPKLKEDSSILFSDVDFIYIHLNEDKTKVARIEIDEKLV